MSVADVHQVDTGETAALRITEVDLLAVETLIATALVDVSRYRQVP
jgi:hypothetical protein